MKVHYKSETYRNGLCNVDAHFVTEQTENIEGVTCRLCLRILKNKGLVLNVPQIQIVKAL